MKLHFKPLCMYLRSCQEFDDKIIPLSHKYVAQEGKAEGG